MHFACCTCKIYRHPLVSTDPIIYGSLLPSEHQRMIQQTIIVQSKVIYTELSSGRFCMIVYKQNISFYFFFLFILMNGGHWQSWLTWRPGAMGYSSLPLRRKPPACSDPVQDPVIAIGAATLVLRLGP